MNGLTLVIITLSVYALAYRFYGAWIGAKILAFDENRTTPAYRLENGYDYVPTNKWVLFGHHFAAIAGAGPLVGPVLAAQFGYLPGALWILIGAVLAGAVHDMVILFASVRYDGSSIIDIARKEVGKVSGIATAIAVLFILVLAMAGLALVVVNALYNSPWGTFTVAATILIAMYMGIHMKYIRKDDIVGATIIGVILLVLSVIAGPYVEKTALGHFLTFNAKQMTVILATYGFAAAVLPVWLLLVPRDYLSTYLKLGVMALLAIGVIIVNPEIRMPAITQYVAGGGPIIPGKVWPYVFITIACGAISGFHSLISSGTTPKMIKNEKDILPVAYGAMLAEGFVAMMALIAATSLIPADYFAINVPPQVFEKLGMHPVELQHLSQMVGENVAGRPGGGVTLAVGMTYIFEKIPWIAHLSSYIYHFIILFEALFILTTIDAGTRVGRYLLQEAGGLIYKPFADRNWWPGIIITSFLISFSWGYLVYGGSVSTIWPIFGASNQLLAGIALALGTTVIIKKGKAQHAWVTFVPFLFVSITTLYASYLNIVNNYLPKGNWVLVILSAAVMILAITIIVDSFIKWYKWLVTDKLTKEQIEASVFN
ncbi:carbon starvation protein [Caldanaerobacter subterraneus subsp. tengcongensis MB4]|uniref:Carbon starvation protein, predicted membrane protein n=2 Tax=Caldanaerobacter subterraneus TaxID=911092 RepID=Q8RBF1_CALS4|nr:carbon starvation protein A [Caldanaerobacter subterraneus]AAM24125.1 Carbon starvation protein, predicted membrane protein [Caldanaerobacter subterraneus subsp. tengcongensis MB4]KKC30051.1 carbon starvation protein, membrane protein [Caldanaerobacter subterraneus subsp. pacificus DSM 12653]MBE3579858.1 carbon starvation protein A [Caldanaerobacter subterraneus]MCS3916352.1 carbon starvation protein [Caldanaerobacter subterraneus subsp. tengcongensis MB4]